MRRTAAHLSERFIHHLLVVLLVLYCGNLPQGTTEFRPPIIARVHAGTPSVTPDPTIRPPIVIPTQAPPVKTPLPTPVPIDPNATPLPAPTPPPPPPPAPQVALSTSLLWPVAGTISQYFHVGHLALDIAAPYGTTVLAAQAGTVTWAGWRNNGGGFVVEVDHGNGLITGYNHLSSIWVVPGQGVSAGQGIAAVGCTGNCTGSHVHFTLVVNGFLVDPLGYL